MTRPVFLNLSPGLDRVGRLLTVEADPARAEAAWAVLQADPRARVQRGDWRDVLREGPFDLIFADCAAAKADPDALARALKPGGTLLMDNFSPPAFIPPDRYAGDPLRDALFTHPQLTCTELEVRRRERVLLAVRTA